MKYLIDKKHITFDKQDEIGSGGEAVIFRLGSGLAAKVYRDPNSGRERKLKNFFNMDFSFPENVAAPISPVYDSKNGRLVGFTMKRVSGTHPLAMLASRNFCDANKVTAKDVVEVFIKSHNTLSSIHKQGIIVGDLNDQNELISLKNNSDFWIDVDSWQIGKHPCMVATQAYLHPDLYGIDLSNRPVFLPYHDWYSFVVLFFRSVLRVHPFRGVHPKFRSLMACAENKVTVLDSGMTYPKIGLPPQVLTDDLTDLLLGYLKRKKKGEFPREKLLEYQDILVECHSCKMWYPGIRQNCPNCSAKSLVDMRLAARIAGCENENLIMTNGKIVFFHMDGTTIYCLADEDDTIVLYKKSKGHNCVRKELFNACPGARYQMFGENLVVCPDPFAPTPTLYILSLNSNSPKPLLQTTTEKLAGKGAVFGCSKHHLYRLVGNMLMRSELFAGNNLMDREVMQILPQQTWMTVSSESSKEVVVGFQRVFGEMSWFVVWNNKKSDITLPPLVKGESLIDISVRFSENQVLVIRKTRSRGVDTVRVDSLNCESGNLEHSYRVKVSDYEVFENIHGKAYKKGVLLHATDQGIVQETLSDQRFQTINSTSQFVAGDDFLYPYPEGIVVVRQDRVMLLKPKN